MLARLFITTVLLVAPPATPRAPSSAPPSAPAPEDELPIVERLDFIGFSMSETEAAWRVRVKAPHQDHAFVDRYTLASVVDVYSGKHLGNYRLSSIRRTGRDGRREDLPERMMLGTNPRFASAETRAAWRKLERKKHFIAKRLKMDQTTIQLQPDDDVTLEGDGDAKEVRASVPVGSSLGYHPLLRLLSGDHVSLGHIRVPGRAGVAYRVAIEAFVSSSGTKVAIINRISASGSERGELVAETSFWPNIARLPSPVGNTGLGNVDITKAYWRRSGEIFKDLHPGGGELFDKLLGDMK